MDSGHAHFWRRLRDAPYAHDRVVYANAPLGGSEQVLEYLGHYTHRVAIDDRKVAFRVRADDSRKRRTLRLDGVEFVRRFLHSLPASFKRIRHYGLLAPSRKAMRLAAARAALGVPPPDPVALESAAGFMRRVAAIEITACPCCHGGRMVPLGPLLPLRPQHPAPRVPP